MPPRPPIDLLLYVIRHVIVFLLSRLIGFLGHRIFLLIKVAKIATNCKYTGLFKTPISSPFFFFLFLSIHLFLPTFLEVPFFFLCLSNQSCTISKYATPFYWTLYILTSVCTFSIQFSIHFLSCWQGEFVQQSRVSFAGDHFLYSHDLNVWFRSK